MVCLPFLSELLPIFKALPEMPIQIHSHMTSGMAAAMYMAAADAGAGCVDCAISTLSSFSSHTCSPHRRSLSSAELSSLDSGYMSSASF